MLSDEELVTVLECLQGPSWPLCGQPEAMILRSGERAIAPIRNVLRGCDDEWQATIIERIVRYWPLVWINSVSPELKSLALDSAANNKREIILACVSLCVECGFISPVQACMRLESISDFDSEGDFSSGWAEQKRNLLDALRSVAS